jgi:hypothetical protein
MDQFGRARGGSAGQVIHLGEKDGKATSDGIAGDAATIDAATYDENVTDRRCVHKFLQRFRIAPFLAFYETVAELFRNENECQTKYHKRVRGS